MSKRVARYISPEATQPSGNDPPRRRAWLTALTCACLGCIGSAQVLAQSYRINDVTVTEGQTANFTVTRSGTNDQLNRQTTINFATADETARAGSSRDYIARSGTLTFNSGVTTRTIAVTTNNDSAVEPTETFRVNLSNASRGTIADSRGIGTILDNDAAQVCSISVNPTSLSFGNVNVGQTATRSTVVTNTGTASCALTIARSGTNEFALTSPASIDIPVDGNATVSASYTPNGAGADTGNLAISGSGITTVNVSLTGTGAVQQVQCDPANLNRSINSTSQDGCPEANVQQVAQVANASYSVLAINDLGMHCGDLDTRIASILPPFQAMLAQVIQKGTTPTLNPAGVSLSYSAVANPNDPILGSNVFDGVNADGTTYKTNFWDTVAAGSYDPFYPAFNPFNPTQALTPLNIDPDVGLPVPNVEEFYLGEDGRANTGDEGLSIVQHAMPGIALPYTANNRQLAREHYIDKPFFINFPFGYVAEEVNWYEGVGIPFAAFDDNGRENAYPLVRVEARNAAGTTVSTVDTVLPISGEASCVNCHADPADLTSVNGTTSRSAAPTNRLRTAGLPVATSLDDPDGNMPPRVSLEYAADINTLRLHDFKHGANYVTPAGNGVVRADRCTISAANPNGSVSCLTNKALVQNQPVVCQVCHYTPALDLAHLGPLTGPEGTVANGRNHLHHKSNSNVMHSHHGSLGVFPVIPAPVQATNGTITNQPARLDALENSCYQCHPGTNVQCLRGAMFNGGMLCTDCHGNMEQVGNDFTANVTVSTPGPAAWDLDGNFYTDATQPRVPWANEPGCGSCHTGDATSRLTGTGLVVNNRDTQGNVDNIRLRQAFRTGDLKATPIVPTNKRFAEPVVPATTAAGDVNRGAGNPQLYRVSTGHGGVMCEGCHGATHAEWPNGNPNANDNVTASQLQGHVGTIIECGTCHTNIDALGTNGSTNSLRGPHGMHVVGNTRFANGGHESSLNRNACRTCHGQNGEGSVLSRTAADRNLPRVGFVAKGTPIRCNMCHDNEL